MEHHHPHNSFISMICGAVLGIARAVSTTELPITGAELFKVILFGALGALSGLIVKDIYQYCKRKITKSTDGTETD